MTESTELPPELESLLNADGEGPALRIDAAEAERLIAGAIAAAGSARVTKLPSKRVFWLLAAAIVFGGSAAAMYAAQRAREADTGARPPARPVAARTEPAAQPPAAPSEPAPSAEAAPSEAQQPALEPQRARGQQAARVQDLLRRANRLRGEGSYREAERTYLRVLAHSPNGAPAYTARVAAAALRVERLSDPRGAIRLYSEALRMDPQGPLAPEIHEGMANAYRKLGRLEDERRALQALLARQPGGPAAARARARLQALEQR